ncbi:MAG: cytochrome c-type biogenesis protein CcmH [Vicinamibacterales bacterium]
MLLLSVVLTAMVMSAPPDTAAIEREAKQIERLLIAPCCWTQPVSDHYSADADRIRVEVRQMLSAGQTREAILDSYVAKYGQRILVEPRPEGFAAFLHYLPWVFLATGGATMVIVVRKFARRAVPGEPASPGEAGRKAAPATDASADGRADREEEDSDRLEDELSKIE